MNRKDVKGTPIPQTNRILGDYATQFYLEDIGRLCNTMLRWRYLETMLQNITMKILGDYAAKCYDEDMGDYATKCYDEDIGILCNKMLRRRYWETMQQSVTTKILGDYATQCYNEVGRGSSLNRGELMMKCVGTGGLCSLLRHESRDQYCGYTATHLGPLRRVLRTRHAKKDGWFNTFPALVLVLLRTPFHVPQVTRRCYPNLLWALVFIYATWRNVQNWT
jgi:hypothetical protein